MQSLDFFPSPTLEITVLGFRKRRMLSILSDLYQHGALSGYGLVQLAGGFFSEEYRLWFLTSDLFYLAECKFIVRTQSGRNSTLQSHFYITQKGSEYLLANRKRS